MCDFFTHFFTFEPRGAVPSSFACTTWCTLKNKTKTKCSNTVTHKVTSTISKSGICRRGRKVFTYWWSRETWLSLETLEKQKSDV